MSFLQFLGHLLDAQALGSEENDEVIEHVRPLINHAFIGAIAGLDDQLQCLLSDFLCHAIQSVAEVAGGVGPFGHLTVTLLDEVLQFGEEEEGIL